MFIKMYKRLHKTCIIDALGPSMSLKGAVLGPQLPSPKWRDPRHLGVGTQRFGPNKSFNPPAYHSLISDPKKYLPFGIKERNVRFM